MVEACDREGASPTCLSWKYQQTNAKTDDKPTAAKRMTRFMARLDGVMFSKKILPASVAALKDDAQLFQV